MTDISTTILFVVLTLVFAILALAKGRKWRWAALPFLLGAAGFLLSSRNVEVGISYNFGVALKWASFAAMAASFVWSVRARQFKE